MPRIGQPQQPGKAEPSHGHQSSPWRMCFASRNNKTSLLLQPLHYTLGHLNLQATTSDCILSSPHVTPAFPKEKGLVKMP